MKSTASRARTSPGTGGVDAREVETIGGYRIIRRLGSGERSDVYLGHAAPVSGGEPGLAAIKVFRAGVSDAGIDAEISALSRLQHPHIIGLLDLATGPSDKPSLVLQRLGPGGLPVLLAGRRRLELGEAVTALAPIVAATMAMHSDGVAHGGISARSILFDGSGAPVISGFGSATLFASSGGELSQATIDAEAVARVDRVALVKLVMSVVGRSAGVDDAGVELIRWLTAQHDDIASLSELEQRIFQLAEPLPVQFADPGGSRSDGDEPVPSRLSIPGGVVGSESHRSAAESAALPKPRRVADVLSVLPPEFADWVSERVAGAPSWMMSGAATLRGHLRSVRRSVWVVAALGLTAVAGSIVVAELPEKPDATVSAARAEAPGPVVSQAIAGDDPIAAVGELLTIRARCLHDRSILCLDGVHAADSAAWRADAERIRAVRDGAEIGPDSFLPGSTATLVDRLGQTALVELATEAAVPTHTTASVLMIRTEAGWRFRSLVAGSAPVDGALP